MTLLDSKPKRKESFVGAHLPLPLYDYMTLYTIAKGTNKSKLIRTSLDEWYKNQVKLDPEMILLEHIVRKAKNRWAIDKTIFGKSLAEFKETLKKELFSRGVKAKHIDIILAQIK